MQLGVFSFLKALGVKIMGGQQLTQVGQVTPLLNQPLINYLLQLPTAMNMQTIITIKLLSYAYYPIL